MAALLFPAETAETWKRQDEFLDVSRGNTDQSGCLGRPPALADLAVKVDERRDRS
jgi:hypothetical protein